MSLIISIPFYWFLLFLIETRILSTTLRKLFGSCGNRRAMDASMAQPRMSVKRFTGGANEVDEDVIEEEKRV
jgi:hypothetical protein